MRAATDPHCLLALGRRPLAGGTRLRAHVLRRALHCECPDMFAQANRSPNGGPAPLLSSYSPRWASDALRTTLTEYFDGWRGTSGLSMSFSRSISLIHWSGLSTALTCLAAFEFVP